MNLDKIDEIEIVDVLENIAKALGLQLKHYISGDIWCFTSPIEHTIVMPSLDDYYSKLHFHVAKELLETIFKIRTFNWFEKSSGFHMKENPFYGISSIEELKISLDLLDD